MRYEGSPKHREPWQPGRRGSLCPNDLNQSIAKQLLADSVLMGNKRYAVYQGRAYCAQQHALDIHEILNRLKIEIISLELSDADIRGVSIASPNHRPGIVINERNDHNKHHFGLRFTLAHELCHVLFDRRIGHHLALASGPWAPPGIEKRANAFAAMLLMPPLLVQRVISRLAVPIDTAAGVREAARTLQAGVRSVLSHLQNAGFITGIEHERIANEMFSRFDPR